MQLPISHQYKPWPYLPNVLVVLDEFQLAIIFDQMNLFVVLSSPVSKILQVCDITGITPIPPELILVVFPMD